MGRVYFITGLKKFQINNRKRVFVLITDKLDSTGIPNRSSASTIHDLPITIDVETDEGPVNLTTTVEIKRRANSKFWKR